MIPTAVYLSFLMQSAHLLRGQPFLLIPAWNLCIHLPTCPPSSPHGKITWTCSHGASSPPLLPPIFVCSPRSWSYPVLSSPARTSASSSLPTPFSVYLFVCFWKFLGLTSMFHLKMESLQTIRGTYLWMYEKNLHVFFSWIDIISHVENVSFSNTLVELYWQLWIILIYLFILICI